MVPNVCRSLGSQLLALRRADWITSVPATRMNESPGECIAPLAISRWGLGGGMLGTLELVRQAGGEERGRPGKNMGKRGKER